MKKIRAICILLVIIIVATVTGCGSNPEEGSKKTNEKSKLTVGIGYNLESMDPTWEATLTSKGIFSNMYETLVNYDASTQKFKPSLAVSWKQVDNVTLEFKLRKNVKFSDGTKLKAEDVVYSLQRLLDSKVQSRMKSQANFIKSIEAVDDSTVRVISNNPNVTALGRLSTFFIVGKASMEKYDDKQVKAPVGTGPFKFVKWDKTQQIVIDKNKNYWGTPAQVDEVRFKNIPSLATRTAELSAGSIDVATQLTPDSISDVEKSKNAKVVTATGATLFIGANIFEGPLKDKRVRQAMAEAIDSKSISKNLYQGTAQILNQPVTSKAVGYSKKVQNYEYNVEHAKKLLAEAGYPNGFTVDYNGTEGKYSLDKELIEMVAQQLSKIGVKVNVNLAEYGTYWSNFLAKKNKGLYDAGITNPIQDADYVLDLQAYSKGRGLYYNTPETDALIEKERTAFNKNSRQSIFDELMAKVHDDTPWIVTLSTSDIYGVSNKIENWKPGDYGYLYFGTASIKK